MSERKVVLYISMSLDGFIATQDDDLSWLSVVQKEGLDYGYSAMQKRADTYIVGRRTYEIVKDLCEGKFPQSELFKCYVISTNSQEETTGVEFYSGNMENLIQKLKAESGKDIYCDGGSQIVHLLMKDNLIDEYIISVIPICLGGGIPLFKGEIQRIDLKLKNVEHFETGLVQLTYEKKKSG